MAEIMKNIAVFCGSASGSNPAIREVTEELGRVIARDNYTLVYGGASVGLMGLLADSVLDCGGEVIGVIPKSLERKEIIHGNLKQLIEVDNLHERKAKIMDLADAFITLPGGLGTLDEFFEVITWAQLGLHRKPIGILNACGYYDALLGFLDRAVTEQFVWPEHKGFWKVNDNASELIKDLKEFSPPSVGKWIQRSEV